MDRAYRQRDSVSEGSAGQPRRDSAPIQTLAWKAVFLVWAPSSPRAEGLAKLLNARLYQLTYKFKRKIYAPIKYPLLFSQSLRILKRERPDLVVCQDPPVFCALAVLIYRYFSEMQTMLVVDAHTAAFGRPWSYIRWLHRLVMRKAVAVLVTNAELRDYVLHNYEITPVVLEDKVPDIKPADISQTQSQDTLGTNFKVAVISSFAPDEPIAEIMQAAEMLPDVKFYITGDSTKSEIDLSIKPENVTLTGFLDKESYLALLGRADALMVLTKRDMTMLAGAYEALALGKPLITSDWLPLKRYFSKGAVYTDNSPQQIVQAVRLVQQNKDKLADDAALLRFEKEKEWNKRANDFVQSLLSARDSGRIAMQIQEPESQSYNGRTDSSAVAT